MTTPAFNSAVIESETADGGRRIVSFGASLFLERAYVDRELRQPRPDCNSRIIGDIASGKQVFCRPASLTGPASESSLDLFLLCSSFRYKGLDSRQQAEVSVLLPQALVYLHEGYRVGRIFMETTQEPMRVLASSSGVWKTIACFPNESRALMVVTNEEIKSSAGFSVLAPLFRHRAPVLGLRNAEKHLLSEAIHGETDAELASRLYLSLSSVRKRWSSLFLRLAETHPGLLKEAQETSREDARGMQKRHKVLTYIRSHPEELRPFRSYPRA